MAGRKIGEIYGEIKLKNQQFNTGLKQSQSKLQGFKVSAVAMFAAVAAGSYILIKGIKGVVTAASNLEEQTAKFGTVFRGVMDEANKSVETLTELYGMSTREAREHMAAVQDLLVPMGMMRKEAANLSSEIVKLATDLGSFNNLPTEQVMNDIESALTGQYRTMRKYGVVLFDTDVRQRALNMGLAKTNAELTAGDRALAAYEMMMEGSKDAQGDFIRTSDSFANSMKILNGRIEDLKATIGDKLLPTLADWIGDFSELTKEVTKFMEKIGILEKDNLDALIQKQHKLVEIIEYNSFVLDENDEMLLEQKLALREVEKQIEALLDKRREEVVLIEEVNEKTEEYIESLKQLGPYLYEIGDSVLRNKIAYAQLGYEIESTREIWGPTLAEMKGRTIDVKDATAILTDRLYDVRSAVSSAFREGANVGEIFLDLLLSIVAQMIIATATAKALGTATGAITGGAVGGGGFWGTVLSIAGAILPFQKGGYVPGQLLPQVSSGRVTQPSILVGEGREGETVVPDSRWKDMITVNVHNANPHTYVETLINLPQSEKQRLYRRVTKEASDIEGRR